MSSRYSLQISRLNLTTLTGALPPEIRRGQAPGRRLVARRACRSRRREAPSHRPVAIDPFVLVGVRGAVRALHAGSGEEQRLRIPPSTEQVTPRGVAGGGAAPVAKGAGRAAPAATRSLAAPAATRGSSGEGQRWRLQRRPVAPAAKGSGGGSSDDPRLPRRAAPGAKGGRRHPRPRAAAPAARGFRGCTCGEVRLRLHLLATLAPELWARPGRNVINRSEAGGSTTW
ncbi:hypothetical protein VPH35_087516 [Triticum aestivum]|uniref:uncharacterized protein n=1 Tax=Triticum aestivum TaxID=4565 RepID=UPI001D023D68|nr:uncharacterized protein LOC123110038 [Triticum aestivum]XP_044386377.1 uncharacterized protein LOC123110038 [Triticum aestivum]